MSVSGGSTPRVSPLDFRSQVEAAIHHYDMLPGIQAICKNKFKRLADYQISAIKHCFKRSPEPSVIIGGREVSKTFSIALGYLLRAISAPNFEVYLVPGQKIDQAQQALDYVNTITRYSRVLKPMSGLIKRNNVEWSTMTKRFLNGSLMHALAPNEGVVSKHGCVWCDEYQELPDAVDTALQGFTGRDGDRMLLSGTSNKRGSPLHRAYKVAKRRYPKNILEIPVQLAIDAGILNAANIEAKKSENGGKLSPVEFDAWFNCKFPDEGDLAWCPLESDITRQWCLENIQRVVAFGTGIDPGIPACWCGIAALLDNGQVHFIEEFEVIWKDLPSITQKSLGDIAMEYGKAFHAGFNFPYHERFDELRIPHVDSHADGDARKSLFSNAFSLQANDKLYVNPKTCSTIWRACEEQTFNDKGEMDDLPLDHWIFVMLHGIHACQPPAPYALHSYDPTSSWL